MNDQGDEESLEGHLAETIRFNGRFHGRPRGKITALFQCDSLMSAVSSPSQMTTDEDPGGAMFVATRDTNVSGGVFVHGNRNVVTHNTYNPGRHESWRDLHTRASPNAMHDSKMLVQQGICLENTREAVLELLNSHLSSNTPEATDVIWLNGPAGAGKSAIARTIAKSAGDAGTLLANFFFYHSDTTRNTIVPFIPTLAAQVCRKFSQVRRLVEQAIEDDPFIFDKPTRDQASTLIIGPLKQALAEAPPSPSLAAPMAILIDGLDECHESDGQLEVIDTLLELVAELNTSTRSRVKVAIISRPEAWIRKHITPHEQAGRILSVSLDDDLNPRSDVELYYNTHFEKIRRDHPMGRALGPSWPSPDEKKAIFKMTGTHFALAHTIHVFVADPNEDPRVQLSIVLDIGRQTANSPHTYLDQLYAEIFSRVPKCNLAKALRLIGAILVPDYFAIHPSPVLLELVFSLREGEVQESFAHLESLFDLGDRVSSWIRVYHKTLADFLFDETRSRGYGLFIDKSIVYQDIGRSVRSIFLRERMPSPLALAALHRYLSMSAWLEGPDPTPLGNPFFIALSQPLTNLLGTNLRPPWMPWAVVLFRSYSHVSILYHLTPPSFDQRMALKGDTPRGPRQFRSVYEDSASGRLCLVLARDAFLQTFDKTVPTFYQAFIRHAIQSEPTLLKSDREVGLNLGTCKLDNLAMAVLCFDNQPFPYQSKIREQVVGDLFSSDWTSSRLGLLRRWHEFGHRSTDDPWELKTKDQSIKAASKSRAQCAMCFEVIDICKAQILRNLMLAARHPTLLHLDHRMLYFNIHTSPVLWNDASLVASWMFDIRTREGREPVWAGPLYPGSVLHRKATNHIPSTTPPAYIMVGSNLWTIAPTYSMSERVASGIEQQLRTIEQTAQTRIDELVDAGWDREVAMDAVYYPYSRACIPIEPSDLERALRVAKQRIAWHNGVELPDVLYTHPGDP